MDYLKFVSHQTSPQYSFQIIYVNHLHQFLASIFLSHSQFNRAIS